LQWQFICRYNTDGTAQEPGSLCWWHANDELTVCSCLLPCLQKEVAKLANGLFYCWPLLHTNNTELNLQTFTSSYSSRRFSACDQGSYCVFFHADLLLISDGFTHRPNKPWPGALATPSYNDSLLTENLGKIAEASLHDRRGITSQYTFAEASLHNRSQRHRFIAEASLHNRSQRHHFTIAEASLHNRSQRHRFIAEASLHNRSQRHHFTIYFETSESANVKTYQYSNNTMIWLVMQYKNDNTTFHRCSAVSVAFALKSDVTTVLNCKNIDNFVCLKTWKKPFW